MKTKLYLQVARLECTQFYCTISALFIKLRLHFLYYIKRKTILYGFQYNSQFSTISRGFAIVSLQPQPYICN